MDLTLLMPDLDANSMGAGTRRTREALQAFDFAEYDGKAYGDTVARGWRHVDRFLEEGLSDELRASMARPYQWQLLGGSFRLGLDQHEVEIFEFPVSADLSGASIAFSASVHDALHGLDGSDQDTADKELKRQFVNLLVLIARSFHANAFGLRPLDDVEELLQIPRASQVVDYLMAPDRDSIRRWRFLFIGVAPRQVERKTVEQQWPAEQIKNFGADLLVYDAI